MKHTSRNRIRLYQSIFERYSSLALTRETDKVLAISSLEQRLASVFGSNRWSDVTDRLVFEQRLASVFGSNRWSNVAGRLIDTRNLRQPRMEVSDATPTIKVFYGIFENYLHRGLLWRRASVQPLLPITFLPDQRVPSWSWMAYSGRIKYLEAPYRWIYWSDAISCCSYEETGILNDIPGLHTRKSGLDVVLKATAMEGLKFRCGDDIVFYSDSHQTSILAGDAQLYVTIGKHYTTQASRRWWYYLLAIVPSELSDMLYTRVGVAIFKDHKGECGGFEGIDKILVYII
jgi:hypothetical protein